MHQLVRYTLPILLGGLMTSSICLAAHSDKESVAARCQMEAFSLIQIMQRNPHDKCTGDVGIAAAYLNTANVQIHGSNYHQALVTLHHSENELRGIAYSRPYCDNISQQVKPSIGQIIRIIGDVEALGHN